MPSTEARAATPEAPSRQATTVARRILRAIERHHPDADTELHYTTPFELLVATILSAQCTDARVNQVTPALFRRYPDARSLARGRPATLERLIQTTGFFRSKARSLLGMAHALVEHHGGDVPASVLCQLYPRARWTVASDTLILHGRRICKPRPLCDRCGARPDCAFAARPETVDPRRRRTGPARER